MKFFNKIAWLFSVVSKFSLKFRFTGTAIVFYGALFFTLHLSAQNNQLVNYDTSDGLPDSEIIDLTQDEIGYLWLVTKNSGIVCFDGTNFKTYAKNNGLLSNAIHALFVSNGRLLVATDKGLSIKIRNKFTHIEGPKVLKIFEIESEIFLGTEQGVYMLKEDYIFPLKFNYKIDLAIINDLLFDGKNYWVATNKSLWKVDRMQKPTKVKLIDHKKYTALLLHKNKIVGQTYNSGINIIENDTISRTISTMRNTGSLQKINDQFWVCSRTNGIEILKSDDFSFIRKINKYNDLDVNQVSKVFQDRQNNIWIATSGAGIYKYSENNGSYYDAATNSIIQKGQNKDQKEKPVVFFEDIEVMYQPLDSIDINNYTNILQLSPRKNNVSFSFKTVDINHSKKVEYRYKLGTEFSPWSSKNSVNLASLKPGNYTFTIQSRNSYKTESEIRSFQFFIDTPLYKKPGSYGWFFLLWESS